MQRGIARLDRQNPLLGLGLRVGIAVGEASSEEDDWYGTPVVEAARLCAAARSGQILVADVARQLVGSRGGHRFTSMGPMELKGLEPLLVSAADWEPESGHAVIPLPSALESRDEWPFVGRRHERDRLENAWQRIGDGRPRLVLVTGEQGIGRTRLAAEVARPARPRCNGALRTLPCRRRRTLRTFRRGGCLVRGDRAGR